MKSKYPITRSVILLALLGLMTQACTKGMNPTAPSASTVAFNPTATPAISAGVSEIYWYSAALTRSDVLGSVTHKADVYLSVNGQDENSAKVILTGASSPITIPYNSSVVLGGQSYAHYSLAGGSFSYNPGVNYTLSTITSVGTAWTSVTAPGGITVSSNGSSSSWNSEGTNDRVFVENSNYWGTYDSLATQDNVNSVFNIPLTAYPSHGSYFICTTTQTIVNSVNNAMTGSFLTASDQLWSSISR